MLITVTELIGKSLEFYRKNALLFLKYMLLLFIPAGITAVISSIVGPFINSLMTYGFGLPILLYLLVIIICFIFSLWINISFIKAIAKCLKGEKILPIKEEFQLNLNLLWPVILTSVLTSVFILLGFILVVIPGIIISVWLAFSITVLVLENKKPMEAIKTSKELCRRRWWAVLWRLFAPALVFNLALLAVQWLVNTPYNLILNESLSTHPSTLLFVSIIFTILNTIVALLFAPLSIIFQTVLYFNLKETPLPEPLPMELSNK